MFTNILKNNPLREHRKMCVLQRCGDLHKEEEVTKLNSAWQLAMAIFIYFNLVID